MTSATGTSCKDKLYLKTDNTCTNDCGTGLYGEKATYTCEPCIGACKTCSGNTLRDCLSCKPGYYLNALTGECVIQCDDQYYKDATDPDNPICQLCSFGTVVQNNNCYHCSSLGVCTKCAGYFFLVDSKCVEECDYNTNSLTNLYESMSNNKCMTCPLNCATCDEDHLTFDIICKTCSNGYYKLNNECVLTCTNVTYPNKLTHTCSQCSQGAGFCLTCVNNTYCLSCEPGMYLMQNKYCGSGCNCVATDPTVCTLNVYPNPATWKCDAW